MTDAGPEKNAMPTSVIGLILIDGNVT